MQQTCPTISSLPGPSMPKQSVPLTSPRPLPLARTKLLITFYSTFLAQAYIFSYTSSIFANLYISFLPCKRHFLSHPLDEKACRLFCTFPAYLSHLLRLKAGDFLNALFCCVYSFFWSRIPFSFPVRPVSA